MTNLTKILAIITASKVLLARADASGESQLKGLMVNVDPYIQKAIERAKRLYHVNEGALLPATESQLSETETHHAVLGLDITRNYNIVITLKPLKIREVDEPNNMGANVKIILAPIVSMQTDNRNIALSSFYCATNIGPELIYGQEDIKNIRSPLADATYIKQINNCMYVSDITMEALVNAAYPS